ncbi:restriction endonuclease subunit S [uncultured Pseudomonas sp.]|uniref:restriction endonuclease subunit S n=1 Tax=uncultured Pseudomonas sp. TaxID=114707 RepID=UPI000E8C0B8D|nr:hypothetical protein [Pseudomonas sp.]
MAVWNKIKVGDFLFEREGRYKPESQEISGFRRVDKIDFSGNFHIAEKPSKTDMILIKQGDLVISGINVAKGALGVYHGRSDVTATIHYSSYTFDESKVSVEYFKRFLKSPIFIQLLKEQVKGGIKTEIKPKHLLSLEIMLPDKEEQLSILRRFQRIENEDADLRHELNHQQTLLKKLRQRILQEAIEGKLSAGWRAQNPNLESASELIKRISAEKAQLIKENKIKAQKPLPPISDEEKPFPLPHGWEWCRLGDIAEIKVGATPDRNNPEYWGGTINWISSGEVANNYIGNAREKITQKALGGSSARINPKGSVLVAMIGQGKTRGQAAILNIDAATNQNVCAIRPYDGIIPEIIWYFFLSRYERTRSDASGGNQPALNGIKIRNTVFGLPSIPEANEIIRTLRKTESLLNQLVGQISKSELHAEQLMKAVLKEAFSHNREGEPAAKKGKISAHTPEGASI